MQGRFRICLTGPRRFPGKQKLSANLQNIEYAVAIIRLSAMIKKIDDFLLENPPGKKVFFTSSLQGYLSEI